MGDSIGQMLREAREERGLTLQETRRALRIHASYLEALEAEEFDKLPAPVYVRAFLRQYARFLNLDPEPMVEQFNARHAPADAPRMDVGWTAVPQSEPRSLARAAWVVGLGLAVLAMGGATLLALNYQAGKEQASRQKAPAASANGATQPKEAAVMQPTGLPSATPVGSVPPANGAQPAPAGTPAAPAAGAAPAPGSAGAQTLATTAQPGTQPAPAPDAGAAQPGAQTPAGAAQPGTQPSTSPAAAPGAGVEAVVTSRDRCWVAIRVDGAVVFEGVLQPGESRTWKGARVVQMRAGNASAVSVSINGQDQGSLGNAGQVVDRTFRAQAPANASVASAPIR